MKSIEFYFYTIQSWFRLDWEMEQERNILIVFLRSMLDDIKCLTALNIVYGCVVWLRIRSGMSGLVSWCCQEKYSTFPGTYCLLFIDQIEKNSTHLQHSYFDSWNIFTILPGLDKISSGEGNASPPYQTWVVFYLLNYCNIVRLEIQSNLAL